MNPKRYGNISGSGVDVLFPVDWESKTPEQIAEMDLTKGMKTYAAELASGLCFDYADNISTWQTRHGHYAEPLARAAYFTATGELMKSGIMYKDGNYSGQPDDVGVTYGVDYKCPTSLNNWLGYLFSGISKKEFHQCQMYMELTKLDTWYIIAFLTETEYMLNDEVHYPIPEEKRIVKIEVKKQADWRQRLDAISPKLIAERDRVYSILKQHFK